MRLRPLALFVALACACNSAPKNTCTEPEPAIAAAGKEPATCPTPCATFAVPADAGIDASTIKACVVNCTGNASACDPTTVCTPVGDAGSFCITPCDDAGLCSGGDFCVFGACVSP